MGKREFIAQRHHYREETEKLLLAIRKNGFKSQPEDDLLRPGALYKTNCRGFGTALLLITSGILLA
ncbi:hypothetical protein KKB99_02390 [bacterium]|nr:hypothetical protein [bacterium]MBU1024836.1 hypothetical protein [bacterium]